MDSKTQKPLKIHLVSSTESPEYTHLTRALTQSSIIGLDAEWKPLRSPQCSFPTVSLLQLACQSDLRVSSDSDDSNCESVVFLLDLSVIHLSSIWELLKELFISPDILKLGFKFKQDLIYMSSTFCLQGCEPGFDRVEPYLDISSLYNHLQHKQLGRKFPKDTKSLSAICKEVLGISLSKELQCSDWSHRPLSEEQKSYAATDAQCLLNIFHIFQAKVAQEGHYHNNITRPHSSIVHLGLKEILEQPDIGDNVVRIKCHEALDIIRATAFTQPPQSITEGVAPGRQRRNTMPMDGCLLTIVRKYGEKIMLREADRRPKTSKRKGKRHSPVVSKVKQLDDFGYWKGPVPWDSSVGGDGYPKFLCDVMVEGLAKHLRCVGIDAATPRSRRPQPRDLIDQAHKEKRVILTRDAKLLQHQYLLKNQIYRVKSLLKNEQLLEIIENFQLKISEDQLMSRCTKCNGKFIQKPLSTEEAIEAAKGFQRIPDCLFNKNLEFWQCMDCSQLYWEGTQYQNAVQKFIDICKLSDC